MALAESAAPVADDVNVEHMTTTSTSVLAGEDDDMDVDEVSPSVDDGLENGISGDKGSDEGKEYLPESKKKKNKKFQ